MLGVRIEGDTRVAEFSRPNRVAMVSEGGGLSVSHVWTLERITDNSTRLKLVMDFQLPARWLTGFMEPLLVRENRQQVAVAMSALRHTLEAPN